MEKYVFVSIKSGCGITGITGFESGCKSDVPIDDVDSADGRLRVSPRIFMC